MENMSINTVTIICSAGEKLAKLSFLKPNPPVPAVEKVDVLGLFFFMKVLFMLVLAFVWYFESHDRFLLSCVLLELLQKKLQHLFSLALFLARSPASDQLLMTCNKPNNEAMKGFRGETRNPACWRIFDRFDSGATLWVLGGV